MKSKREARAVGSSIQFNDSVMGGIPDARAIDIDSQ
jgi:hypothetical protein